MWYGAVNFRLIGICSNGHVYLAADSPKVKDKAGDLQLCLELDWTYCITIDLVPSFTRVMPNSFQYN